MGCRKPVFSDKPVSPALPPAHDRPALRVSDPILRPPVVLDLPSTGFLFVQKGELVSSCLLLFLLAETCAEPSVIERFALPTLSLSF